MKSLMLLIVISGCALSGCAELPSHWSSESKIEEGVYQAVHVIDAGQTLYIASRPESWREAGSGNAIIGSHPNQTEVYEWWAATAYVHAFVASVMECDNAPVWMRRTWQVVTIVDAAAAVRHNHNVGIKVAF